MTESSFDIDRLEPGGVDAWNAYVEAHPDATFFHRAQWSDVFQRALGHRTHYLTARTDGRIVGVLPLVHIKSWLFGSNLASLPFSTSAGCLADDDEIQNALEDAAIALARELGVAALELRNRVRSGRPRAVKTLYDTFYKPISADPDENMKAFRSKQRNVIRKGIKVGLASRVDGIDPFFRAYSESVRNLGTPVFPRRLFKHILEAFPDDVEFLSAYDGDNVVSSAMLFYFRDQVCPYYWGGVAAARKVAGNDFLTWEIMCRAAERGCRVFDFGRSKQGTGAYQWKVNLGFEPVPLFYEYDLIGATAMPDVNPLNPKYRVFISLWKKLPLPVTQVVGPWVSTKLG